MGKGGARVRSGPPPDPTALRRERDEGAWTVLPAEGRAGDPPRWPLLGQVDREAELWADLWRRPQALMWERHQLDYEVALYVRNLAMAELPGSPVNLSTLLRQQGDSLGLTMAGMLAHKWRVERDDQAAPVKPAAGGTARRASARNRLTVVPGGASGGD